MFFPWLGLNMLSAPGGFRSSRFTTFVVGTTSEAVANQNHLGKQIKASDGMESRVNHVQADI